MGCIAIEKSDNEDFILEGSLVLTAVGVAHEIYSEDQKLGLYVDEDQRDFSRDQLFRYHSENNPTRVHRSVAPSFSVSANMLVAFVFVLTGFFYFQNTFMTEAFWDKASSSAAIFTNHAWWRAITSLFLHADSTHFSGNLFAGVLMTAVLASIFGSGLTWTAFLFSGAVGNAINAYVYRHADHFSIGFSTAVFGAVGAWAGYKLHDSRHWIIPVGTALAILGLWGASPDSDFMAHFWGLIAGGVYGVVMAWTRLPARLGKFGQAALSTLVAALIAAAWIHVV
ncbi:MAG: rhomboid family intramembrane serine protease [Bdellovibrionota bacterium]